MAKQIKDMIQKIFRNLTSDTTISESICEKHQIYVTPEEYDDWCKHVHKMAYCQLSDNITFAIYNLNGINYLLLTGLSDICSDKFDEVDNLNVLSLSFIHDSNINRLQEISSNYLWEHVFIGDGDEIENVSPEVIFKCYPHIITCQFQEAIPTDQDAIYKYLDQIIFGLLCKNKDSLLLPFESSTLFDYIQIANDANDYYPINYLIRSLLANTWKTGFLEIYRCIERLYGLAFIDAYRKQLKSSLSVSDALSALRSIQGNWLVCHEDQNIAWMIDIIPEHIKNSILPLCNSSNLAKWVYSCRNESVHYQKEEKAVDLLDDSEWNIFFRFLLQSIKFLYSDLNDYLNEEPDFYGLK